MALAPKYSIHPTSKTGGYVGIVIREALASEVAAAV